MRRPIPAAVIAAVARAVSTWETHESMDRLFAHAGAPGEPPLLSKEKKAVDWLRRVNRDQSVRDPLAVIGLLIEGYMEDDIEPGARDTQERVDRNQRLAGVLERAGLRYVPGGKISGSLAAPSATLADLIRGRDLGAINHEFERAYENVDLDPREAVSAACNILESVCKTYIEDEGLEMPKKQDLQPVWTVVRQDLGLEPGRLTDRDLQEVLSGLFAVVHGIGALRTHGSSAHGEGRRSYKLEGRHARLAIHSAHTVALFIIETWDKKKAAETLASA